MCDDPQAQGLEMASPGSALGGVEADIEAYGVSLASVVH
jgi:hypothetical protein